MEGLSLVGWYHLGVMRAGDAGLEFVIRRGGGCVDSGPVIFVHMEGALEGKFIISRNWLVLGGSRAPDVKTWEKKVCIMYLVSPVPEPLRRTLKMAPF